MWQVRTFMRRLGVVVLVALITLVVIFERTPQQGRAAPAAALAPAVVTQVFDVNCTTLAVITPTYERLANLGTFTVHSPDSEVELTYNGRIFVNSFASGSGATFELRVDNLPSTIGRARANLRAAEAGGGGQQASISGYFTGLSAGTHTASIWVRTSTGGSGSQAMVDPGCWSTDVLIVREFTPFGFTFLPAVSR